MIVFCTRPENHEVVMGGWRSVIVWTDVPHFHHWPVGGYQPMSGTDPKATYMDRGWAYKGDHRSGCRFKPLAEQNPVLEENAWKLIFWSCIPKKANIQVENAFEWGDTLLPGEDINNEFHRTNRDNLLYHVGGNTDIGANVHYKRFLMKVNLLTAECKVITPKVHFYDGNRTAETQEIDEYYGNRRNYSCPEMDTDIPF